MPTSTGNIYLGSNLISGGSSGSSVVVAPTPTPWVRNPSWPAQSLVAANAGTNRIKGHYAVFPGDGAGYGGNFFSVVISGAYTINFGDGQTNNYASGVAAYYEYSYNDPQLANTNAPVTFTASTNIVNRTSHGYSNGMIVNFYNIVTTTGLIEAATYYVVNATANTFKVSLTEGGSAVSFTNNGTATLLPYKVALVTITPQAGNNLTSINFYSKHNQASLTNGYSPGWLEIEIAAPSCTSLTLGGTNGSQSGLVDGYEAPLYLERVCLNQLGAITSFVNLFNSATRLNSVSIASTITTVTDTTGMFYICRSLTSVPLFNTSAVTNMSRMFGFCFSLTTIPLFDTSAVTDMSYMFWWCESLIVVPLLDTSAVTVMNSMFNNCHSLTTVPLFNTSVATNMSYMLQRCFSLTSVPLLDTSVATDISFMFDYCHSLTSVPLFIFNTSAPTNTGYMFSQCYALTSVPLFNTSAVTQMTWMFNNCRSLTSVPLFNTSAVTNMSAMFFGCYSITSFPLFVTSAVTNMQGTFDGCHSITSIPLFDTSNVTNMATMLANCASLTSIPKFDMSKVTRTDYMLRNCYGLTTIPLLDTSKVTTYSNMFYGCHGFTSIPALDQNGITAASGGVNIFIGCNTLARIQVYGNKFTHTIANCKLSATALNEYYTNLPTVTGQTLTVTGNYGVSGDNPAIATAKGWTVTG